MPIFSIGDEVYWVNWNDKHYGRVVLIQNGLVCVEYGPYIDHAWCKPENLHHAGPGER